MSQLNGISLINYAAYENEVTFSLDTDDVQAVVALSGQTLIVTNGEDEVERFDGYKIVQFKDETTYVQARFMRKLDDATAEAIKSLEANVRTARAVADEASAVAQEAKDTASQAGTDPQVKAASAMYVNAQALSNTQLADVRDLIEDFVQGAEYEQGWVRRYEGRYYRMAQKITSTTSQTYLPGTGTESLYTLIDLAPDGIRVWHAPTDATNSFALGELAHYPDADGPVYVSGRNGNTSEPGTDAWWTLKED